jgi:hypothetical protein
MRTMMWIQVLSVEPDWSKDGVMGKAQLGWLQENQEMVARLFDYVTNLTIKRLRKYLIASPAAVKVCGKRQLQPFSSSKTLYKHL